MPSPGQLDEQITTGGLPGGPHTPPTPGTQVSLAVQADRSYVAGSRLNAFATMARALPWSLDDVSTDFGADLYARMLLDSQVRAVVNVLKSSILETGITIRPAIEDKAEDGYELAVALHEKAERQLGELEVALDDVLWDLLDAIAVGNRMAEQVYALDRTYSGAQEYTLTQLAVRPMESVAFVVDVYFNTLGILARIPGQPFGVQQGMLLSSLETAPNLLPRSKFGILTFRPRNNDPRGTSILRPAFDAWNRKREIKLAWLAYLAKFATPSVAGFTAPEARTEPLYDAEGQVRTDTAGNPLLLTPEEAMLTALQGLANGTAIALPNGAAIQTVQMSGNGEAFLNALAYEDIQIVKAVLNQTLATEEGQHQTRAASGTHKDILDTVVRQGKRPVERMLERDVLRVWARLNGWQNQLELLPTISLGTTETEDQAEEWTAMGRLYTSGYVHPSQLAGTDAMLGMPARTPPDAVAVPAKETVMVSEDGGSGTPPASAPDDEPETPTPPAPPSADETGPVQRGNTP